MILYIVRHGQTEENKLNILQGHMPGTLTEQGREQVRRTAEEFANCGVNFRCIVSSDLKRAMDSALIISERLNLPIVSMEMLRERDWGEYTGITIAEAKAKYFHDGRWDFPGRAESDEEILERARMALKVLYGQFADDTIIVVTHGQFARNLLAADRGCSYHDIPSYGNAEVRVVEINAN
jgi:probable phosphoglycerate mutase